VVADCFYGDHDDLRAELRQAGWGFVMALKPSRGAWQYQAEAYTPRHAARAIAWTGSEDPGDWTTVERRHRDGHTETWWAVEASLGWWGPDGHTRLVVATTDPTTLPDTSTWYLPRSGGPHDTPDSQHKPADLAEVVRPPVRHPELDRAKLRTGQRRTRLGRLPGLLREGDPPSSDPGQLRLLVLLEHLVRQTVHKRQSHHDTLTGAGQRRPR
jgi:hypothetical protein